jgi:hypothetical protein
MPNSKISALTSATTPLAGTEALPIVQSGATTQVSVANLTAGRAVSGLSFSAATIGAPSSTTLSIQANGTTYATVLGAGTNNGFVGFGTASPLSLLSLQNGYTSVLMSTGGTGDFPLVTGYVASTLQRASWSFGVLAGGSTYYSWGLGNATTPTERMRLVSNTGDLTNSLGNYVPATAAKGINFTANTPAAGMTSQLLNWYEEGTWTPNQGAGLTLVGAFSSTGRYTRIGRQVSISGTVTGATSVAVTAAGVITSNLPFTVVTAGHGDATNVAVNAAATVICTGTSVTSASAIVATGTITFSATYFV